jgi:hypothetical protein
MSTTRDAPLALPLSLLAVLVSIGVALQVGVLRLFPGVPLLVLALASRRLQRPRWRLLYLAPITVGALLAFSPFGHRALLFELLFAGAFVLELAPLALVGLRVGDDVESPAVGASCRRSPWVVAAALVAPLTDLAASAEWDLAPDSALDAGGGVLLAIYVASLLAISVLTLADVRAAIQRKAWSGPLGRSLAIDLVALAIATASVGSHLEHRAPRFPHGSSTSTASLRLPIVPSPSAPCALFPQHRTRPGGTTTQV